MKNIYLITLYTLREAFARKIFIIFLIVSTLTIIGFGIFFAYTDTEQLLLSIRQSGMDQQKLLKMMVSRYQLMIVAPLYGIGMIVSIFSTAGIISHFLEKGNVDLFISKPVSRTQLLLGKYLGGVAVVFANAAYVIIGVWILLGLKFSYWDPNFLLSIVMMTFTFAVVYALVVLLTVLSRTTVLSLVITYMIFFVFSPILAAREKIYEFAKSKVLKAVMEGLYYIVPQTQELGNITVGLSAGEAIKSFMPVYVSAALLLLTLFAGITIFSKKDY